MIFFTASIIILIISSVTAPLSRCGSRFWDRFSLIAGLVGVVCGFSATVFCLIHPGIASLNLDWPSMGSRFVLHLDPLAGIFLLPAFFIAGAGLLYGSGYWRFGSKPGSSAWIRFFYPLLTASIAVVFTAGNAILFLISWEIMALSGYFLILTERQENEAQQAGIIYLVATHTGTLALFGMFALLGEHACLISFPAAGSLAADSLTSGLILLLALLGFGFKAGIIPLHIWLPRAHAAAPSHVSALMSGVMIKTGIYGILRVTGFFNSMPSWWGWLILGLGVVSGLLGVLFAIAQHDIKRLLAYHSVENIGIILIGIGLAMLAKGHGLENVAILGLAGALLHVINHGLFKGLLFLSGGSVIHAVGTRQLSAYGGLLKSMPFTGIFFLGGAVAICGLPPLNGFVSEWFIYLGLLRGGTDPSGILAGSLPALVSLAMIGGLALLCFAKVFGLTFLGTPRSTFTQIHEAPRSMLAAMMLLFAACLWIGILPVTILPLLDAGSRVWLGISRNDLPSLTMLAPTLFLSIAAAILAGLLVIFFLFSRSRKRDDLPRLSTWGCGFAANLKRAQYSPASFTEMIMKLLQWLLLPKFETKKPEGLFPASATFLVHTPDIILDRLITPAANRISGIATTTRRLIQHGFLGIYLLYIAASLCLLLVFAIYLT
ncbi:MAG: proton-conducting transporter transmembrane domain-containing protein [Desulfobulbales bacterium]